MNRVRTVRSVLPLTVGAAGTELAQQVFGRRVEQVVLTFVGAQLGGGAVCVVSGGFARVSGGQQQQAAKRQRGKAARPAG